jgi:molybdopterin/thiamine biosynthesis adenylyltransferase
MAHDTYYDKMVERNIGVLTKDEQKKLKDSCVAIAGCGGMGGLSGEQLVRLGVGRLKISDFDSFEANNLNRQHGSKSTNIGHSKVKVLSQHFKEINPGLELETFEDGVQDDNVDKFLDTADIAIDGIDYNCFYNTILLDRAARQKGVCVIHSLAVGMGISAFVFGPDTMSVEEYVGLPQNSAKEKIAKHSIPLEKFAPYFPSYIDRNLARMGAIAKINFPNIIMPQCLGTAIAVSEAVMILLGRVKPPAGPSPRIFTFDMQDRKFIFNE